MKNVWVWFTERYLPRNRDTFWIGLFVSSCAISGCMSLAGMITGTLWLALTFMWWVCLVVIIAVGFLITNVVQYANSMRLDYLTWKRKRDQDLLDKLR